MQLVLAATLDMMAETRNALLDLADSKQYLLNEL